MRAFISPPLSPIQLTRFCSWKIPGLLRPIRTGLRRKAHTVEPGSTGPDYDHDVWELYDTNTDWTQAKNLAKQNPKKLAELQRLFIIEGTKYSVFLMLAIGSNENQQEHTESS